jgi:hypothetical protein
MAPGVPETSQRHVLDTRGRHHSLLAAHSPTVITAQYRADPAGPTSEQIQAVFLTWAKAAA